jgi:hypothetical protein
MRRYTTLPAFLLLASATMSLGWDEYTVGTTRMDHACAYNNQRKMVQSSDGTIFYTYPKWWRIYVALSTDGGETWNDMGGGPIEDLSGHGQQWPALAIDSMDRLHAVWVGTDDGNPMAQIKYARCDGGSWSPWMNVARIAGYEQFAGGANGGPSLAVDASDGLHLVWTGLDPENSSEAQIKYCHSTDGGGHWSPWESVAAISGHTQYRPTVEVDRTGRVHVAWWGPDEHHSPYQVKYSFRHGDAWAPWRNIGPSTTAWKVNPSLMVDRTNNLFLTCQGTASGWVDPQIFLARSTDRGETWAAWLNISKTKGYRHYDSSIVQDVGDTLYCVWRGYGNTHPDQTQVKYARSTDGGLSWSGITTLTSSPQASLFTIVRWATWNLNGGILNVAYSRETDQEDQWVMHGREPAILLEGGTVTRLMIDRIIRDFKEGSAGRDTVLSLIDAYMRGV